jgi:hypothetical protein
MAGAIWIDKKVSEAPVPRFSLAGNGRLWHTEPAPAAGARPASVPPGWRQAKALRVSPILSKLYQESGLRDAREA